MSEEQEHAGPLMLCATSVLKPGPTRIGKLGGNITLPRTVATPVLIAVGIGAFGGMLVAMIFLGGGFQRMLMAGVLGGALCYGLVTYQPTPGESLLKVIGLEVLSRRRRITVDGVTAQAYIGICPITHLEGGSIRIVRGAANVPPGSVDEHGSFVVNPTGAPGGLLNKVGAKTSRQVGQGGLPEAAPEHADTGEMPQWAKGRNIKPSGPPPGWGAAPEQAAPAAATQAAARPPASHPAPVPAAAGSAQQTAPGVAAGANLAAPAPASPGVPPVVMPAPPRHPQAPPPPSR